MINGLSFLGAMLIILAAILLLLMVYLIARIAGEGWFRSRSKYIQTQRKLFNELLEKSKSSIYKKRIGD